MSAAQLCAAGIGATTRIYEDLLERCDVGYAARLARARGHLDSTTLLKHLEKRSTFRRYPLPSGPPPLRLLAIGELAAVLAQKARSKAQHGKALHVAQCASSRRSRRRCYALAAPTSPFIVGDRPSVLARQNGDGCGRGCMTTDASGHGFRKSHACVVGRKSPCPASGCR